MTDLGLKLINLHIIYEIGIQILKKPLNFLRAGKFVDELRNAEKK